MIERLKIKNFQCHTSRILDFDIGITTILGPSDIGKSAIVRAIKWVVLNRPNGGTFITDGEKEVDVVLDVDGNRIIRHKSKKDNTYSINSKLLEVVKTKVPDEISLALRMNEINFQSQHDNPFWLSLTAGEVSRQLNTIVNLEVMDKSLSNLDGMKRQANTSKDILTNDIGHIKTQLQNMWVWAAIDKDLKTLENSRILLDKKALSSVLLDKTIKGVQRYRVKGDLLLECTTTGSMVVKQGLTTHTHNKNTQNLSKLVTELDLAHQGSIMSIPDVCGLEQAWSTLEGARKTIATLEHCATQLELWKPNAKQKELDELEAKLKGKLKGRCPLCGKGK